MKILIALATLMLLSAIGTASIQRAIVERKSARIHADRTQALYQRSTCPTQRRSDAGRRNVVSPFRNYADRVRRKYQMRRNCRRPYCNDYRPIRPRRRHLGT